ncbi:MAG TPA: M28 family peptidase [Pedobacter sp.]|nr:M28 family peptidase [Pedobacter sp.]
MKKRLLLLCLFISSQAISQDLKQARILLDTLTSKTLWGRGYTKGGMSKAAEFIAAEFNAYGLRPMEGKHFQQNFSYSANTFPGAMVVKIDGKALIPGKDFILLPESAGKKATGILQQKDSITFIDPEHRLMVRRKEKLTWSVAMQQEDYTGIEINKASLKEIPKNIEVDIESSLVKAFKTANICGMVRGTSKPDSLLLITAHYDHLGGMGRETYFPGANDNASGIAFLLSLAKYYAANPQPYSIGFICFAGEEAGLMGSKYFTENPLIPLEKIRFLINVDMVGTGETGITVVNATLHQAEFAMLNKINDKEKYLIKINSRGKAANSDHYFFTEKSVPAFFIYTQGGISAYHDVNDIAATLPFTEYEDLFRMFVAFNKQLMNVR